MLAATDEYRRPIKSVSRSGITMPATFTPDHLRAGLRPLAEWQPLSTEGQAYQTFYGLDFRGRTLRKGLGRFAVDGYEVVSQVWWPARAKATVSLFHVFSDHARLYRRVVGLERHQGFAVIARDLPGHGLSS